MNEAKCGARFVQHWKPDCAALIQATLATSLRRAEPYPSKEACVGAHHLSRKPKGLGHDARLMPAKYVRPYSKGQKNEFREAEAIAEAVQRPTMKFVATKTADQLDLQALHRVGAAKMSGMVRALSSHRFCTSCGSRSNPPGGSWNTASTSRWVALMGSPAFIAAAGEQ
jgi:hypothetical protein